MADDSLIIKIAADTSAMKAAMDSVVAQVSGLQESLHGAAQTGKEVEAGLGLEKLGELSKEVFEVLKEQLTGAIEAYAEAEAASRRLDAALQSQGIYTGALKDAYTEYSAEVSHLTGIQADQLVNAQAVAQQFLGQVPVTEELTKAIADLATAQGISLPAAAQELGKAIGNGTGQLIRQGLQFSATSTESERYAKALEFVTVKYGGQAEAANQGLGSLKGLQNAFHENAEELGARFAPAVTAVIQGLTAFLTPSEDSTGAMVDFKAAAIAVGLVLAGIGVALPVLAQAFLAIKAAVAVFNLELTATKLILAGLGIGLVVIALTELALHWESVSGRVMQIVKGLVGFVSGAFGGLGKVLQGAFHLDSSKIKEGLNEITKAFSEGVTTATATIPEKTDESLKKQDEVKKKWADKFAADKRDQEQIRVALQKAEDGAIQLELEHASQKQIDLKKQEIATLQQLQKSKNDGQKALLKAHLAEIQKLEADQVKQDTLRDAQFAKTSLAAQKTLNTQKMKFAVDADKQKLAALKATLKTEHDTESDAYTDQLKNQIEAHNRFLADQNQYGTAYAAINQIMHDAEVEGVKKSTSDLMALTASKNQELKAVGKAASIANIVIKTAESAMNIYAGFSLIPFIGPILGAIGAAAAVAFGAEQIGTVVAAKDGGIVPGSGFGDKIPALLEPGELVAPARNFEEVVSSVAASRSGGGAAEPAQAHVTIGFDGRDAQQVLTARRVEDTALGTIRTRAS